MSSVSEFHARYSLFLKPDPVQMEAIDFLTGKERQPPKSWQELGEVSDPSARLALLTQAIITAYKDYSRVGRRRDAGLLGSLERLEQHYDEQYNNFLSPLCLAPVIPDISMFPKGSWAVSFKFKLRKPYISRDGNDFYIIDNPIRKEWVFKMPYIAASQWKGALRAAMVKQLVEKTDSLSDEEFAEMRFRLTLLFGDEKGEGLDSINGLAGYLDCKKSKKASERYIEKVREYYNIKEDKPFPHHAGCMHFYPTYFTRIGIEVINPHDRETGAGAQPIYFECVPHDTDGVFVLLYVPLHRTGKDREETKKYAINDLQIVVDGICAMMTQYGFGAKTSSGFGLAEKNVEEGRLVLSADSIDKSLSNKKPVTEIPEEFLKYLNDDGTVKQEFRSSREEGLLSNKEFGERKQAGGGNFSEFKKFRDWYKVHGKGLSKHGQSKSSAGLSGWEFKSFDELRGSIKSLAQNIKRRDDST
ncbi:hypothetical protein METP2_02906 [Methanosarcinales archaeon]|nr:hypothetical protein [Candidatus Methanoperedens sp.]CAG0995792.1 hypothetical protein METP2_02906 [Methanosarcinales archaeon]